MGNSTIYWNPWTPFDGTTGGGGGSSRKQSLDKENQSLGAGLEFL